MKNIVFGATLWVAAGLGTGVQAQQEWAGAYGGVSIDAVRSSSDVQSSAVHTYKEQAANVGLFAGYNFVRNNGFVWGPEVSLTSVSTGGTRNDGALGGSQYDGSFLFVPRVRAGYATQKVFLYGIAGIGFTDAMARPAGEGGTDVVVSPTFGLGAEFAMGNGWRTKVEALHHKFDGPSFDFNGNTRRTDNDLTQITIGLSRKF